MLKIRFQVVQFQFIHTYSHELLSFTTMVKKKEEKEQRKSSYMCTRFYFEIVSSGQRSRALELATTTVQLIVRGGYLQNIHEVNTI